MQIAHKERTVYPVGMTSLLRKDGDIFGARKGFLFQTVDGKHSVHFSSVQSLTCFWLFMTPWAPARQASLSNINSRSLWNSCPLSRWSHPTISSSVIPFSSCPQSFPASRSFQMSQPFSSGGQSIGVSASTSDLPMNTQVWSPLGWTGWISLQSKGL